jgi:hypothetical protein
MWPWSRSRRFDATTLAEHRACHFCDYDLHGLPVELRVYPAVRPFVRCVWCPECGQLNPLDLRLPRREVHGWEAIRWMIIVAMWWLAATFAVLWAVGVLLRLL